MNVKTIDVEKPFTYWINGYERRDFTIGRHEVPYDCAAYAEKAGFTKRPPVITAPEVKENAGNGARKSGRGKGAASR